MPKDYKKLYEEEVRAHKETQRRLKLVGQIADQLEASVTDLMNKAEVITKDVELALKNHDNQMQARLQS